MSDQVGNPTDRFSHNEAHIYYHKNAADHTDCQSFIYLPCFHSSAPITFFIQMGNEGSIIAIPMFANVIEPGGEKSGEGLVHSKGTVGLYITDAISEITHLANDCLYRWRLRVF